MGKSVLCPAAESWAGARSERTHGCEWRLVVGWAIEKLGFDVDVDVEVGARISICRDW
jgi:hypothetical protein